MIIVWLAALGASIVVALLIAFMYIAARGKRPALDVVARWALRLWLFNFVLELLILYFAMPALTGPYLGGQWLLFPLLLTGALAIFGGSFAQARSTLDSFTERMNSGVGFQLNNAGRRGPYRRPPVVDERRPRGGAPLSSAFAGGAAIALVVIVSLVVNGLITIGTTWFDPNAQALKSIPQITLASKQTPLPKTDVDHIVLVSSGVAAYLGQQVLASGGNNLGSTYHTEQQEYTLQSVKKHLYWVAPLVYNNVFANLGHFESPGFVAVDAEDPNATPRLHVNYHMRYLPDALLNQELLRHVYLSGYTNGNLADPTLEVDDNWKPYFTVSLMQPSRGFTGDVVREVLLVDAQSGAITPYAPQDVPAFVDRIIPADTVAQYLTWWGRYNNAPWFNPSGSGQQAPALNDQGQPELVYNSVDKPVWLVPMTSSAASDNSSTGVILFDTRANHGIFYPLTGLGVTDNVKTTFESNPANIKNYTVANLQLYQIYNEPTWVATFVQQQTSFGENFQAVGLVDARHLSGANVIMRADKSDALAGYAQWLASQPGNGGVVAPTGQSVTITGKVQRVSAAIESGSTVYSMLIAGQTRIFKAPIALNPELPLVQPGDQVRVTFLDTGLSVVTLTQFDDLSIHVAAPTPAATAAATP